jgi:hypothetical protein
MNSPRLDVMSALIERLSREICLAQEHALGDTVRLLKMAKLNLQVELNGISSTELEAFSDQLARTLECASDPSGRLRIKCDLESCRALKRQHAADD